MMNGKDRRYCLLFDGIKPLNVYEYVMEVCKEIVFVYTAEDGYLKVVGNNWYTKSITFALLDEDRNIVDGDYVDLCFMNESVKEDEIYKILEKSYLKSALYKIANLVSKVNIEQRCKDILNSCDFEHDLKEVETKWTF